ncbi:MAG: pyruvate, phosphate dikinase [Armatimonadetes bacterium 55-13]|nr:pyruvate, phosphate dikinase [Armatimonadota bacterium]OJU63596.1 MAG: pyruvate, phosphate dikinase [Armatimonadetes bacterium 55-13]
MSNKRVYLFREGNATMRDLLGGKGANLAEMTNIGLPVPPGFTITTEVCTQYYTAGKKLPEGLMEEIKTAVADVERTMERTFGGSTKPLLVSVRSGAKFSMPGMMDTVLNLGLNPTTIEALIAETQNPRFVYDSYRRFIMMFSDVAFGLSKHTFDEEIFAGYKAKVGAKNDLDLTAEHLKEISQLFLDHVKTHAGREFPTDPYEQLALSVEAVFRSWNNDRAIIYRRTEKIPDEIGTAVNVQSMVYGNAGDDCGTGVAFTRDPSTGEKALFGEYLMNAQGEDVVAGVRTPVPISELEKQNKAVYDEFVRTCDLLESHYKDMQDLEFTIEHGKLFMLQCRSGKRTGPAAVRIAVEMVKEGLIEKEVALQRVTGSHLDQLLHPRIDPDSLEGATLLATGLAASPGAAVGLAVFDADTAASRGVHGGAGEKVILVRDETNPDDVHGMLAAQGVLTARGGKTSHAAVVARGFGIPCVAGAESLEVDTHAKNFKVGGHIIKEGDTITMDGSSGNVYLGALKLIAPEVSGSFGELMAWADAARTLGVRANADNPRDAKQALEFGAEGIGLCRTEHMFFESDRLPLVQEMILTKEESVRQEMLDKLQVIQQGDFEGIFDVMEGKPVTVRLIDPPLHEFLPSHETLIRETTELKTRLGLLAPTDDAGAKLRTQYEEKMKLLAEVEAMKEQNPMLGLRGVRLSIILPGLVIMQTRAILQAAAKLIKQGKKVLPEIMIPLVSTVNELKVVQGQLESEAKKIVAEQGVDIPYTFGTMIEIPRAALTAGEIAEYAQFFSFGTNDLTQTTFGYSRDDAEGKFLQRYVEQKILPTNPFESIDTTGVGRLMKIAVEEGRASREGLKCGICGEHGGDPASISFCQEVGLDYVSCSPFRVPIARLAAAQAALQNKVKVTLDK